MAKSGTRFARIIIRLYQAASAGFPARCRFAPSCSQYMLEALEQKGFWKGLTAGLTRLARCHPWHAGGFDPVR